MINKKMRTTAFVLAGIMAVRYSEVGTLTILADSFGSHIYESDNQQYPSMMAETINLYYGTMYQGGIHSETQPPDYESAVLGMIYDRGEFVDYKMEFEAVSLYKYGLLQQLYCD